MHRICETLKNKSPETLDKEVEMDETYVCCKEKNKHLSKKEKRTQGRTIKTKEAVLELLERNNKVVVAHIKDLLLKQYNLLS